MDDLETLWANLLGRNPERIHAAWDSLNRAEQDAVYAHLHRMAFEEGWSEPQRRSAQAALDTIDELDAPEEPSGNN